LFIQFSDFQFHFWFYGLHYVGLGIPYKKHPFLYIHRLHPRCDILLAKKVNKKLYLFSLLV